MYKKFNEVSDIKVKDNFELIIFILMNLFAPPASSLVFGIIWGLWGFIGSLILFFALYWLWKYYGKHKGKLTFSPSFTWAGKRYRV